MENQKTYLELSENLGQTSKFYELSMNHAREVKIRFGRIGTVGVTQIKTFDTADEAQLYAQRKIQEKLSKNYQIKEGSSNYNFFAKRPFSMGFHKATPTAKPVRLMGFWLAIGVLTALFGLNQLLMNGWSLAAGFMFVGGCVASTIGLVAWLKSKTTALTEQEQNEEINILKIALQLGGKVSAIDFALYANIPVERAAKVLDRLYQMRLAEICLTENGSWVYDFSGLPLGEQAKQNAQRVLA